jgi:hypothetical protein
MAQATEYGYNILIMKCKEFRLRELATYKFDLVGVQVRWEGGDTKLAGEYTFFYGTGNENHELGMHFYA